MINEKIKIKVEDYQWECGDGCCHNYGVNVSVNDMSYVSFSGKGSDFVELLEFVLKEIGFNDSTMEIEYIEGF